ncbi:YrdB family protein [Lysinibacillus macroides]|nr:YrdB family protein [Lysinibacillus macroides]
MHLALRFLLEIGVLLVVGYWGVYTGKNLVFQFLLGIGLPLLIIGIWSIFGSPKAMMPLNPFMHGLLEIALFTLAVLALYNTDKTSLAITFALIVIFNQMLSFLLKVG